MTMNDIYTWHNDLYPLIKKRFDLRYAKRLDVIEKVCDIVCQDEIDYRMEGVGGYGEMPVYDGTTVMSADTKRSFITTITPKEHALKVTSSYKKAKLDYSGESKKIGTRLADSAYMTVLNEFYRLFGSAFSTVGADGTTWASKKHPVSCENGDRVVTCDFLYSTDGKKFKKLGQPFRVREGKWIGAKMGTFCTRPHMVTNDGGWVDVDWFRVTKK